MAFIDGQFPDNFYPAHDSQWTMLDSDNKTLVDFKYIYDIYVGARQVIRAKIYPDPETGKGYFDASNVVGNEMKFDWFKSDGHFIMGDSDLNDSGQFTLKYTVQVGESIAGTDTLNMASGEIEVVNTIPNLYGRKRYDQFDISTPRFITNREKVVNLQYTTGAKVEDFYVGALIPDIEQYVILVTTYRTGSTVSSSITIPAKNYRGVYQLNLSPYAINQMYGDDIVTNEWDYYTVAIYCPECGGNKTKDIIRINLSCSPKYNAINLHFMNNYGLFDTARFDLASRLSMDVERKTFEKRDFKTAYYVDLYNSYAETNSQYIESTINFGSQYKWNYRLTMNFPSDTDYLWLDELVMSPQIWAEIISDDPTKNKEYYPVSIKATNYEYSKYINNRLRPFEVDIDMNQKRKGFRR